MPEAIHVLPRLLGKLNKDISDMEDVVKQDLGTGNTGAETCLPSLPSLCSKLGLQPHLSPQLTREKGFQKHQVFLRIPLRFLLDTETDQKEGKPGER